jgi:hypothetical protein
MIAVTSLAGSGGGYWQQQSGGEILNINNAAGGVTAAAVGANETAVMITTNAGQVASALIVENPTTGEIIQLVLQNLPAFLINAQYKDPATGALVEYAINAAGIVLDTTDGSGNGANITLSNAGQRVNIGKGGGGAPYISTFSNPLTTGHHIYLYHVAGAGGAFTGQVIPVCDVNGNAIGHIRIYT